MGYQQHPGDLWDGLEPTPEPPEKNNNRTLILVIGGIGLLLGLVICLVAGYLFLLSRTGGTETAEATEIVVVPPGETPAGPTPAARRGNIPPLPGPISSSRSPAAGANNSSPISRAGPSK
ncbi:MAG: hypothetical protein KDE34_27980 [Anaerolineales bacterium]|nr:hypothetical protein [Anaerolineales bacterium]